MAVGTKRWRGTSDIAARTRGSVIPRGIRCLSTMSRRRWAKSPESRVSPLCGNVPKPLLENPQPRDRLVMSQIEVQWGDGDESFSDRGKVRSLTGLSPDWRFSSDPEVLLASRIEPLNYPFGVNPFSEVCHANALELFDRKVHVQHDAGILSFLQHDGSEARGEFGAAVEREVLADQC